MPDLHLRVHRTRIPAQSPCAIHGVPGLDPLLSRFRAHYRTEIEGLYLCGPCMFPGGGAGAAAGYNAFKNIAQDFGLERSREGSARGYGWPMKRMSL